MTIAALNACISEDPNLILAIGTFILAPLCYFAGVQRQKHNDKIRQGQIRIQMRRQAVDDVVKNYVFLLSVGGGSHGAHFETVKIAGILTLESDAEVREAIKRIVEVSEQKHWFDEWEKGLEGINLLELFRFAKVQNINLSTARLGNIARAIQANRD